MRISEQAFPTGEHAKWTVCQALFIRVNAMLLHEMKDVDSRMAWATILYRKAWYAMEIGQYRTTEGMARANLEAREQAASHDQAAISRSLDMLAQVPQYQGQYELAEEINRRALAGWEN